MSEEVDKKEEGYDLCIVLKYQWKFLQKMQKVDFTDLYDKAQEDKVKVISATYKAILETQKAMLKKL